MRSLSFRRTSKVPGHQLGKDVFFVDTDGILKKIDPEAMVTEVGSGSSRPGIAYGSGPPEGPRNAVQQLEDETPGGIDSGTFTITYQGHVTDPIDYNVTTFPEIQALLEALPGIGAGNINVDGSGTFADNGELDVEFIGNLAKQSVSAFTVTDQALIINGNPIDPDDFVWIFGPQGNPGKPSNFASTLIYVDEDSFGQIWANRTYPDDNDALWDTVRGSLLDQEVTTPKISGGAVTTDKIADNAVTTEKITNYSVINGKLANDSVETRNIIVGNVTTEKIANNAVTTAKLPDNVVTEDKIASSVVTYGKLANDAVTTPKIEDNAVTAHKINIAADFEPGASQLNPGDLRFWFDPTNGAAKLMVKAKTANGTVVTAAIPLT